MSNHISMHLTLDNARWHARLMTIPRVATLLALMLGVAEQVEGQTNLAPIWRVSVPGGQLRTGAAIAPDGTIYVSCDGTYSEADRYYTGAVRLHALNLDGTVRWTYSGGKGAASAPTVGQDGTVYFAAYQGEDAVQFVHAVGPEGTQRWRRDWAEPISSYVAALPNGSIIAKTHYGRLFRIDDTGTESLLREGWGSGASVVDENGTIFSGTGSAQVDALSQDGTPIWSFPGQDIPVMVNGLAFGPDSTLYVAGQTFSPQAPYGGDLCALNLDGSVRWRVQSDLEVFAAPAISPGGNIYLPARDPAGGGALVCLTSMGQSVWTNRFNGALMVTPALAADGSLWVVDRANGITLTSERGETIGTYMANGLLGSPALGSNGMLVVTTVARSVIAFASTAPALQGWPMEGNDPGRTHRVPRQDVPMAITNVAATLDLPHGILLSWTPPTIDPAQYEVWRSHSTNVDAAVRIAQFVVGNNEYLDTNVIAGATRYYWVKARNLSGTSPFGGYATGLRPMPQVGGEVWHAQVTDFSIKGIAVTSGGNVYVTANNYYASFPGDHNGRLLALTGEGEVRWTQDFPALLALAPVLGQSNQVVVTQNPVGGSVAYDEIGSQVWSFGETMCLLPPALGNDGALYYLKKAYGDESQGAIYSVQADGNAILIKPDWYADHWHYLVPPLLAADRLWLAGQGRIFMTSLSSNLVWHNKTLKTDALGLAPGPEGGTYVVTEGAVTLLGTDGSVRWAFSGPTFSSGLAVGGDGTVYGGTTDGGLVAISAQGAQRWTAAVQGAIRTTPAIGTDRTVFLGTDTGRFYALADDGTVKWQFDAGSPVTASASFLSQGWVLFGTENGFIWALRADTGLAQEGWPKYQGDVGNSGAVAALSSLPISPPSVVAHVQENGGTVVRLTWDSVPFAETYEVWRALGTDHAQGQMLASNIAVQLEYRDTQTRPGQDYSYWVRGLNGLGYGPWSGGTQAQQTNLLWMIPVLSGSVTPVVDPQGLLYAAGRRLPQVAPVMVSVGSEGEVIWDTPLPAFPSSSPVLGPMGRILLACNPATVVSMTPTGDYSGKWSGGSNSELDSDPAVDAYGTGYFGNRQGLLFGVSADAVPLWVGPGATSTSHPVVGADGVVYRSTPSSITAYSHRGAVLWTLKSHLLFSSPSLDSNGDLLSFTGVGSSKLLRIAPDGTIRATNDLATDLQFLSEPVLGQDGRIYAIGRRGVVRSACAFDALGNVIWTNRVANIRAGNLDVPALDQDGNLYVLSSTNLLVVIDSSGQKVKSIELPAPPTSPVVLTDTRRLYIATESGICAFDAVAPLDRGAPWPMYRRDPAGSASAHVLHQLPDSPVLARQEPFVDRVRIATERTTAPAVLELYRGVRPVFAEASLTAVGRAAESFVDDVSAIPGTSYYYWVRAVSPMGNSPFTGPIRQMSVLVPRMWLREIAGGGMMSIALGPEGNTYLCDFVNLVALDPNGEILWSIPGIVGRPVISPDGDIVVRDSQQLISLSARGTTNWTLQTPTCGSLAPPAINEDGTILLSCPDGTLRAIGSNGQTRWEVLGVPLAEGSPALADNGDIVMFRGDRLARVSAGATTATTADLVNYYQGDATPVLGLDGRVYLAGIGNAWEALGSDNRQLWQLTGKEAFSVQPVLGADGMVFGGTTVTNPTMGLASASGLSVQSITLHPAVVEPRNLRKVVAVLPDGTIKWEFVVGGNPTFLAVTSSGTLMVSSGTELYALATDDGSVKWRYTSPTGQSMGTPLIDSRGLLYVPLKGGAFVLNIGSGPAVSSWPMFRQNARQSACVSRGVAPSSRIVVGGDGSVDLEFRAPMGAVVLRSDDLRNWRGAAFERGSTNEFHLPATPGSSSEFFRVLPP